MLILRFGEGFTPSEQITAPIVIVEAVLMTESFDQIFLLLFQLFYFTVFPLSPQFDNLGQLGNVVFQAFLELGICFQNILKDGPLQLPITH